MSYWSHNPELLDELIFRELLARGLATGDDDPFEAVSRCKDRPDFSEIVSTADREYWADQTDYARMRAKEAKNGS